MGEQGWQRFVVAEGVGDWVVLHGGATAVFRVRSLGEAVRLAEAVAEVVGLEGSGSLLTISDSHLTVRLTRDMWQLELRHVELARAVSEVARAHGATADRSAAQEVQLAIAARPDTVDVNFWRAVLGYTAVADDNAVDPLGHGSTVWMQELDDTKSLRHAMHVDVSVAREHAEARLSAALEAGGRVVDDSDAPKHWTLADRAGNRVCICAWPDQPTKVVEADEVLELLDQWDQASINVWVDGGWGIDALVGRQTREHTDLDIALSAGDADRFNLLMEGLGFVVDRVCSEHNWVLIDPRRRLVDVHLVDVEDSVIDQRGIRVHGPRGLAYEVGALEGAGTINGRPVRCCTAAFQIRSHSGYAVDADDYGDVLALHQAFGLPIPSDYIEAGFHPTASTPPGDERATTDHQSSA